MEDTPVRRSLRVAALSAKKTFPKDLFASSNSRRSSRKQRLSEDNDENPFLERIQGSSPNGVDSRYFIQSEEPDLVSSDPDTYWLKSPKLNDMSVKKSPKSHKASRLRPNLENQKEIPEKLTLWDYFNVCMIPFKVVISVFLSLANLPLKLSEFKERLPDSSFISWFIVSSVATIRTSVKNISHFLVGLSNAMVNLGSMIVVSFNEIGTQIIPIFVSFIRIIQVVTLTIPSVLANLVSNPESISKRGLFLLTVLGGAVILYSTRFDWIDSFQSTTFAASQKPVNSFEEASLRFFEIENVLTNIVSSYSEITGTRKELATLSNSVKHMLGELEAIKRKESFWTADLQKSVEELKNRLLDFDHKSSATASALNAMEKSIMTLENNSNDQKKEISNVAKDVDELRAIKSDISSFVLSQIEQKMPKSVIGQVTSNGIEIHPVFYSYLEEHFINRPQGLLDLDHYLGTKISSVMLDKEQVLQVVKAQLEETFQRIENNNGPIFFKSLKKDIEDLKTKKNENAFNETMKTIVKDVVSSALDLYSADRLALPDYALSAMGSRVVTSLTSYTYRQPNNLFARLFGVGVIGNPPVAALKADVSLGNCWSFEGSKGVLTIALGKNIIPTDFTIEHVQRSIAIDVSSAPDHVTVKGISDITDPKNSVPLAEYHYDIQGPAIQTFPAKVLSPSR